MRYAASYFNFLNYSYVPGQLTHIAQLENFDMEEWVSELMLAAQLVGVATGTAAVWRSHTPVWKDQP